MKQVREVFGQRLEESGVTRIQWKALYFLGIGDKISQGELAKKMSVKDSTIGRLIERMERDGLIERERSNMDRRVVYVILTENGMKYREKLMPIGTKFSNDLVKGLTDEEIMIFDKVLNKMIENIVISDI